MPDPFRVVHLTTVHHPLDPRIYLKEVCSLARVGFETYLLARGAGIDRLEGTQFVPLPGGRSTKDRLRRQEAAQREIREIRPSILHIHDPELIPLAARMKRELDLVVIYDKHEDYASRTGLQGMALQRLEEWAFGWVDHVIIAEDGYAPRLRGHEVPVTAVLNYALPVAHPVSMGPEYPSRLVYTGTVSRARGLFHMLDLATAIAKQGAPFSIELAGICNYPEQRAEAEETIRRDGIESVLTIGGWADYVAHDEVGRVLSRSHIGLMLADAEPNYTVSIPTKFYEFLQYGIPIVASDIPLWRDFIETNDCGAVVTPTDTGAILDLLRRWGRDGRFSRLQASCFESAIRYQWSAMEGRLIDIYRVYSE